MRRFKLPKINSIHFGGIWIGAALALGVLIPGIVFWLSGVWLSWLSVAGGVILLGLLALLLLESRQDNGKKPYWTQRLREEIPFDPEKQIALIRASICTGEQVAGFKNRDDGHFTEVMVIRNARDEERFRETYHLTEIKKEY